MLLSSQGIKARRPKVVPLKVSLHKLSVWPIYHLTDLSKGSPKPKGSTSRVQGTTPRFR